MRCLACNTLLSDFEATRKYTDNSFIDLCNHCWYKSQMVIEFIVQEREDLDGQEFDSIVQDEMP